MNGTFQEVSKGIKPTEPSNYWYLALLGTDPSVQGKGYGSALLKYGLAEHVQEDDYVYLDCGYKNTRFYIKHGGFDVIDAVPINGDANDLPRNFFVDGKGGGGPSCH